MNGESASLLSEISLMGPGNVIDGSRAEWESSRLRSTVATRRGEYVFGRFPGDESPGYSRAPLARLHETRRGRGQAGRLRAPQAGSLCPGLVRCRNVR